MHPQTPKLAERLAAELSSAIEGLQWGDWLPPERELAVEFKASRGTLRQALKLLQRDGVIRSEPGRGNRILRGRGRKKSLIKGKSLVVLLTPETADLDRPPVALPFAEFERELVESGLTLKTVQSRSSYSARPEKALAKLVSRYEADCWILRLSNFPMQKWMERNKIPAVILGSRFEGVNVPCVDLDREALCRHAVGLMVRKGHRKLCMFVSRNPRGGDVKSIEGFEKAVREMQDFHPSLRGDIVRHEQSPEHVERQLGLLMKRPDRPSVLFVTQPMFYLTIQTALARLGLRVGVDISLVAETHAECMNYLIPRADAYHIESHDFCQRLLRGVFNVVRRDACSREADYILPVFRAGGSMVSIDPAD